MAIISGDLWTLTFGRRWIDANALALALESQAIEPAHDFRTRLLVRDSLDALSHHWGSERFRLWLASSPAQEFLQQIRQSSLGPPGFHFLQERLMQSLELDTILDFLRELGTSLPRPASINVGGSIALMLQEVLRRATEDMDVVNEVPVEIRTEHALLDRLSKRFGLRVTHFQSHYLPTGWERRLHSLEKFGRLSVYLVDAYDIFVGKLFSAREKDLDDLRALRARLEKARIVNRIQDNAASLIAEPQLAGDAVRNWYILYGEPFPNQNRE